MNFVSILNFIVMFNPNVTFSLPIIYVHISVSIKVEFWICLPVCPQEIAICIATRKNELDETENVLYRRLTQDVFIWISPYLLFSNYESNCKAPSFHVRDGCCCASTASILHNLSSRGSGFYSLNLLFNPL